MDQVKHEQVEAGRNEDDREESVSPLCGFNDAESEKKVVSFGYCGAQAASPRFECWHGLVERYERHGFA